MLGGYLTVKEFARSWTIPASTTKPKDKRLTSGNYLNWRTSTNKTKE